MQKKGLKNFEKICSDIKAARIQGAEAIAKAALEALTYRHDKAAIERLVRLRPTEPTLRNAIVIASSLVDKGKSWDEAIASVKHYFEIFDAKIDEYAARLIKDNAIIYTHCHSSTVEKALKLAWQKGKRFEVYVTETRPLFQGRITAERLARAGIPVTLAVDSAARALIRKADMFLFGADAITSEGNVINKIGTGTFAEIAQSYDVPCYCLAIGLKYDPVTRYGYEEPIEERPTSEVWDKRIKNLKILNPAFEVVEAKNINAIISEFGILRPADFVLKISQLWEKDGIIENLRLFS
ncbi:MAG: ribose 1,5-bisphosphate isomerase [Candidatus Pacearchaeota archaeon]